MYAVFKSGGAKALFKSEKSAFRYGRAIAEHSSVSYYFAHTTHDGGYYIEGRIFWVPGYGSYYQDFVKHLRNPVSEKPRYIRADGSLGKFLN